MSPRLEETFIASRHTYGPSSLVTGVLGRLEERPQEIHGSEAQREYEGEAPDNAQKADDTHRHDNKDRLVRESRSDSHFDE